MASSYLPEEVKAAFRQVESGNRPGLTSHKGARHEMQVMPAVARNPGYGIRPAADDTAEEWNRVGEELLATHFQHYRGDIPLTAAAYNAGRGAVNKYGGVPPYAETQDYVRKISDALGGQQEDEFTPEEIAQFEKLNAGEKAKGVGGQQEDEFTPEEIAQFEKLNAEEKAKASEQPSRTGQQILGDVRTSLEKGGVGAAQSMVGLADLVSGGEAGKYVAEHVTDMEKTQKELAEHYSPQQKAANKAMQEAHGVAEHLSAAMEYPSSVGAMVGESLPSTVLGGVYAKGLKAAGIASNFVAAGIGEGIPAGGGVAESLREQSPEKTLNAKGTVAALGTFGTTSVLGGVGSKLTTSIGGIDPTMLLAGFGREAAEKSVGAVANTPKYFKGLMASMFGEGILEEAPQGATERMFRNYATDKPLTEGVEDDAIKGAITGAVTAGGMHTAHAATSPSAVKERELTPEGRRLMESAAANEAEIPRVEVVPARTSVEPAPEGTPIPEPTVRGATETPTPTPAEVVQSWGVPAEGKMYKDLIQQDLSTQEGINKATSIIKYHAGRVGFPKDTFDYKAYKTALDEAQANVATQAAEQPEAAKEVPVPEEAPKQPLGQKTADASSALFSAATNLQEGFKVAQEEHAIQGKSKTMPKVKKQFNKIFSSLLSAKEKKALYQHWFEEGNLDSGDFTNNEYFDQAHNNLVDRVATQHAAEQPEAAEDTIPEPTVRGVEEHIPHAENIISKLDARISAGGVLATVPNALRKAAKNLRVYDKTHTPDQMLQAVKAKVTELKAPPETAAPVATPTPEQPATSVETPTPEQPATSVETPTPETPTPVEPPAPPFEPTYSDDPEINDRMVEEEADIEAQPVPMEKRTLTRAIDRIMTYMADDSWHLHQSLARHLRSLGLPFKVMNDLLIAASKAQAVHHTSLAAVAVKFGRLVYDMATLSYTAVADPNNMGSLHTRLEAIGKQYGKSLKEIRADFSEIMVARRVSDIRRLAREALEFAGTLSPELRKQYLNRSSTKGLLELAKNISTLTEEDTTAILDKLASMPELEAEDGPITMWNNIRHNAIHTMVELGYWTKEKGEVYMDNMMYSPFFRDMTTQQRVLYEEDIHHPGARGNRGLLSHLKEYGIKGSKREVLPILDNMEAWLASSYSKAIKNHQAVRMLDIIQHWMPKGTVNGVGIDKNKDGAFFVMRDGIKTYYRMADPLMTYAFTGMGEAQFQTLVKYASPVAKTLRNLTVLNPIFTLGQLSQDTFAAMYTSGVKHPFSLPLEVTKEFIKTLTKTSKTHDYLHKKGGTGSLDWSDLAVQRELEVAMGASAGPTSVGGKVKRALDYFTMAGDNAVRQAVYNQTIKEMGTGTESEKVAIQRALEIINFRKRGASASVDAIRQIVPFFGAYLQVQSVALKTLSGTGITPTQRGEALKTLATTTAQVAMMSFLYNALAAGDDDYEELDPTFRDSRLYMLGANTPITIPLRKDVFLLPHSIMTHGYNYLIEGASEHPEMAKKYMANAILQAIPTISAMPTMIKAPLESLSNYDSFTMRPIVGTALKERDPSLQYGPPTSETMKQVGALTSKLPASMQLSPMQLDHLFKGFFGSAGGTVLAMTDIAVRAGMGLPYTDRTAQEAIRAFVPGSGVFSPSEKGSRDQAEYYDMAERVTRATKSLASLKGDAKAHTEYKEEHKGLLTVAGAMKANSQALNIIRDKEAYNRNVANSIRSPAEKREVAKELERQRQAAVADIRAIQNKAFGEWTKRKGG